MNVTIAGKPYSLGRIKANPANLKKLFNASDHADTPEGQFDFLELLEMALVDGNGAEKASEAMDNLSITEIALPTSDYARAYAALLELTFGTKAKKEDAKS